MKAYLIDPVAFRVTQVELPPPNPADGHLSAIYAHLECKVIEAVSLDSPLRGPAFWPGDIVYVDEEGLFKSLNHFHLHGHEHQGYAGRGLVVGTDKEGDTCEPKATLEEVQALIAGWGVMVA